MKQYQDGIWVSERALKRDKFNVETGKRHHLPDGLLILPNDFTVAIEIELSNKGKDRLKHILNAYGANFSINEVWYFCSDQVLPNLKTASEKKDFIKVHNIKDWLP